MCIRDRIYGAPDGEAQAFGSAEAEPHPAQAETDGEFVTIRGTVPSLSLIHI